MSGRVHRVGQSHTLCVIVEGCLAEASAPHSKVRLRKVTNEILILDPLTQRLPCPDVTPFNLAKPMLQYLEKKADMACSLGNIPHRAFSDGLVCLPYSC